MPDSLIIVESPTKVKTIKKYLGADYDVLASKGHIKDLPKKTLGIDPQNEFQPTYSILEDKKKVISDLKKAAKNVTRIFLAPDPDREGEAIAWHIAEEIKLKNKEVYRVLFNDLTKNTILDALSHPCELDFNKYEAQQTRRILDRLVGYQISPLLWEKVKRGLSAGRVQSVAVRMICEREEEINSFKPEEYWNIAVQLKGVNPPPFEAKLAKINGKKAKVANSAQAEEIVSRLSVPANAGAAEPSGPQFIVSKLEKKEVKKASLPPFTTSKLQQEASRLLRFSAKKTMMTAQKLYEGIELGEEGPVGLITYMRTDSVRIAEDALHEVRSYIRENYDPPFLPSKAHIFKNKGKTQDAHEAIRPASMNYRPQNVKKFLTADQFRLYSLIWNRFVASQMNPAIYDQTTIHVSAEPYLFRAQGAILKFAGYTIVYTEGKEDKEQPDEMESGNILPDVQEGELLTLLKVESDQKFTQPPPRFSEASLVRELEEKGIGRPSTYATILSTIQDRNYASLEQGKFHPTELGMIVTELLVKNFPKVMDVSFTASMENQLDLIEEGKQKRLDTLQEFYAPFEEDLSKAKLEMRNIKREETPTDLICEKCSSPMVIKWGRNGKFLACSNYPECKNTRNITPGNGSEKTAQGGEMTETLCPQCGKNMMVKHGRFGRFLGCSGYPDCKATMPISLGVKCPQEGCNGQIIEKRTKKGRSFFGCSNYPDCAFAIWDRPVPEPCPRCNSPFLVEKYARNEGSYKACPNKECGYKDKDQ
ncbi:MAG: DNA topoisomerase 1 [Syntrophus sp. PtaU1.Bin208]|nr:MAG: DNA topoisomerase 1 [Syntrophus sp. PtaU1.Bin208]